jgi:hypothetical protein
MKPAPWSFSKYDTFQTCPRMYAAKYVWKSVVDETTPEAQYGLDVHKTFELYVKGDVVDLPAELATHEPFMKRLRDLPGTKSAERKVGLTRTLTPCDFLDPEVWWRGIIDYTRTTTFQREGSPALRATIVDYKTGNPARPKVAQLNINSLYAFAEGADLVDASFYWTRTGKPTRFVYDRSDVPDLWAGFAPGLHAYVQAYRTDQWPPKPNGLCHGWCPVKDCEFWRSKR